MTKLVAMAAGAMLVAGCVHDPLTTRRCESALNAADTADQLLAALVALGVEPRRASALRDSIRLGRISIAAACAAAAGRGEGPAPRTAPGSGTGSRSPA